MLLLQEQEQRPGRQGLKTGAESDCWDGRSRAQGVSGAVGRAEDRCRGIPSKTTRLSAVGASKRVLAYDDYKHCTSTL